MKIEQVKLRRTLKAGKNVWVEGSYFPNREYPSIPHEILSEVRLNTGTVEVTKKGEPELFIPPKMLNDRGDRTSTSVNVKTSLSKGDSLEEAPSQLKQEREPVKSKRKPKLVRR